MTVNYALSIQQFVDAWHVFCEAAPGRALDSQPGIEFVFAGVPIAFFNAAILSGSDVTTRQLRACGEQARAWADPRGVPWILVATQEVLTQGTDSSAALDDCGYAPAMSLCGMLAQDVTPIEHLPEGLTLKIADDDASCAAVIDINSQAYALPLDPAKDVWGKAAFWSNHVIVLGSVDEQPVSSAAVLNVSGHRYVALVATAPGQQRRGYADAAMRRALEVSRRKHGTLPTFLHATEAGRPVYERMGYETVATHVAFMDKKFLGEH